MNKRRRNKLRKKILRQAPSSVIDILTHPDPKDLMDFVDESGRKIDRDLYLLGDVAAQVIKRKAAKRVDLRVSGGGRYSDHSVIRHFKGVVAESKQNCSHSVAHGCTDSSCVAEE